jgi:L-iditol 2-dehydrogenase
MSQVIVLDPPASKSYLTNIVTQNVNGTSRQIISTPLPNPSLMVTANHTLKQEEAPVYLPAKGEVLVHIKVTGVCG